MIASMVTCFLVLLQELLKPCHLHRVIAMIASMVTCFRASPGTLQTLSPAPRDCHDSPDSHLFPCFSRNSSNPITCTACLS
eukprot:1158029-Pelagomonas_calceolata.AAC.8